MCVITVSTGTLRCTQESLEKGSEDYPHHKVKQPICLHICIDLTNFRIALKNTGVSNAMAT